MASKARSKSRSGGSTFYGILVGVVLGLVAAVAVALFVTQAPMPFVDRASREPEQTLLPDARHAPDPNIGLAGKPAAPGDAPAAPPVAAPGQDDIGKLIASLDIVAEPAPVPAPPRPAAPLGTAPAAPPAPSARAATYLLQVGAFRSEKDAEALQARILLLGLPVTLQKTQVNGATLTRVRVGPFRGIDEMNRSRVRLGEEKIESAVVRP